MEIFGLWRPAPLRRRRIDARELDVWARRLIPTDGFPEAAVQVELLCECKNNAYSVVFLGRPRWSRIPQQARVHPSIEMD